MRGVFFWLSLCLLGLTVAAETVEITDEACARAEAHVPNADVAFKPGVDVQGNAVAPADLPSRGGIKLPQSFTIDIAVPLKKIASSTAGKIEAEASLPVGKLGVDIASGQVTFNGEPLGDPELAAIAEACRKRRAR